MARSTKKFNTIRVGQNTPHGVAIGLALTTNGDKAETVKLVQNILAQVQAIAQHSGILVNGVYADYKMVEIEDANVEPSNELIPRTMFDGSEEYPQPSYGETDVVSSAPPTEFHLEEGQF